MGGSRAFFWRYDQNICAVLDLTARSIAYVVLWIRALQRYVWQQVQGRG